MRRGRVNVPVLVGGLLVTLPLFVVLILSFGRDPRAVPSMLEGQPAPSFTLKDLQGDTVTLAELQGQKVVLNFWSTWCLPCKDEHPLLQQAAERWPDVQFLGVLYADEPVKATAYLKRAGSAYPTLVDPDGAVAIDYGVAGVPETYFIDESGQVVHKQVGPVNPSVLTERLGAR